MNLDSTNTPSMYNNFKIPNNYISKNNATISQYKEHHIVPANTVTEYDMTGGILTTPATGLSAAEFKMYNDKTWFSVKKWRTYGQHFNGNGSTGGKNASGLKNSKSISYVGKGIGLYNFYSISTQYSNNKISTSQLITEQMSNAIATFGGLEGAAWGIGWELGRFITTRNFYQDWKQETWLPWMEENYGYQSKLIK